MGVRLVKYGVINGTGTYNHDEMENRDLPDQHPISAITELEDKLKQIDIDISNVPGIEKISNTKSLTLSYDKNTKTLSGNVSITCVKTPSLTLSYNSSSSALTGNVNIFNSEDNAIQQRITGLFVDKYPELELEDTNSIHLYLEGAGETLKTMYENGNVFSHNGGTKNIANESEAKAWYFDDNLNSFVQPKNTKTFTGFVSNIKYKTYTHRATLRSSDADNDANGLVIAYVLDENRYPHTLSCIVNKGKNSHAGNFTYAVVYNRELDGETIVQTGTMSSGHTTGGWSNNFITMEVFKSGNTVECSISDWGSLTINSNTLISINLDNYSWGKYFTGKVQYGYCNQSQAKSYFTDIYFKGKGPLKGKVKISTYANNAIQQKENGIYVDNSYFLNKDQYILLTKFSEDSDNNLLYNGNPIKGNGDVKKLIEEVTGDLAILTTTQKDTLTDSINELVDNIDDNKNNIGELGNLLTTNKDTLVNALNEVFQSGCDFKEAIANAITAKDGTVVIVNPKTATKDDFILAINKMSSSGTNITGGNASMIICCDSDVSNSELIYSNSTSDLTITKHTDKLDNSEYIGLNFILNTSNGSYTEIFETSSISNIMYGKYSMIIRLKTSTLSSDSIMKINIIGENRTIIYSTEIKGSWFNEVDTYEIFGITFEIKEQNHKNLRIIIYSGNAIGVNIDFDYIMINNVFTSIGSI